MGAADANGLVVSYIQSLYWEFGSGCVLPATGVLMQNRGSSFSLDPKALNALAPEKGAEIILELERQGMTAYSVPQDGQKVLIQPNGNVAFDVTDKIHPSIAYAAALSARVVGLDIAGIDLVCEDISRPLDEQRGAVIEVNASPGLLAHLKPANGEARPVGTAIIAHLFEPEENGRIPIVGVTGTLYRALYGSTGAALSLPTSAPFPIPGLSSIPLVGDALFAQPPVTYLVYLLAPLFAWWLARTHSGLALRAINAKIRDDPRVDACLVSVGDGAEAGVNLRLIQEWLGHNSPATTSVYTHLTVKAEQRGAAAINHS